MQFRMQIKKIIPAIGFALGSTFVNGQIAKDFQLITPADAQVLVIEGNKTQKIDFVWGNPDRGVPNVNFDFTFMVDSVGGDFNLPIDNITKSCCSSYFKDTSLSLTYGFLSLFVDAVSQQGFQKPFLQGDTVEVAWEINSAGVRSGCVTCPEYDFRISQGSRRITFVRGQLDDEYIPLKLVSPAQGNLVAVQGSPSTDVLFQWNSVYCPAGCGAPKYTLLIDTVDGDFFNAASTFLSGNNGTDTFFQVPYNVIAQLLDDMGCNKYDTRQLYWRVVANGNGGSDMSRETRAITAYRGVMNNENVPYELYFPADDHYVILQGAANTPLIFRWGTTSTPLATDVKYTLMMDTAGFAYPYTNPMIQLNYYLDPKDTFNYIEYGELARKLDSTYGPSGWDVVKLTWFAQADVGGFSFYPEQVYTLQVKKGNLIHVGMPGEQETAGFRCYPNPARESQVLEVESGKEQLLRISLADVNGKSREICYQQVQPGTVRVNSDLRGLAPGVYFYRISLGEQQLQHRFVVMP